MLVPVDCGDLKRLKACAERHGDAEDRDAASRYTVADAPVMRATSRISVGDVEVTFYPRTGDIVRVCDATVCIPGLDPRRIMKCILPPVDYSVDDAARVTVEMFTGSLDFLDVAIKPAAPPTPGVAQ